MSIFFGLEGYDGGDCCSCTCQVDSFGSGCDDGFACIDPEAPCVDDDDVTVDMVENCETIAGIGETGGVPPQTVPQYRIQ